MIPAHKAIPAVLAEVLRKAPLCPEKVEFAWRAAVGPAIARVTRVSLDEGGVLQVRASEPHWAQAISRSSRIILARLAALLGEEVVRQIAVIQK